MGDFILLILDNEKHYDNLIAHGFEKYPNKRDLLLLCQMWYKNGTSFDALKDKMVDFCFTWNPHFNLAKNEQLLLDVIATLNQQLTTEAPFSFNYLINIYKEEILEIKKLKNNKLEKILFIIICLAKWRNANFIYLNAGSSIKLKDIFDLAQVKATKKQQLAMLHQLTEMGYLQPQLKPLMKCFIPCIVNEGTLIEAVKIDDAMINMLPILYMPRCARCGKPFEQHSNRQKYCPECARIVNIEKTIQNRLI